MFHFTALLGAQSSSRASQSILELDGGIKILVDVGWDESFDIEKLKDLERQIPTLSVILLTHATTAHIGAFAHCCKHFPLFTRIPIYATTPVISLGRTLLQDIYASTPLAASIIPKSALTESSYSFASSRDGGNSNILLPPPTAEEIAGYFSLIHPLKYSQPHQPLPSPFSPPLNGLTVTAYSAGHTLGGTIWHVQHGLESIVYAVDWNQAREHVLSGAAWLGGSTGSAEVIEQLRKPTALVCSSRGLETNGLLKSRDENLLALIKDTIGGGGTVLIPTDSSARVLELTYVLEEAWSQGNDSDNPLRAAKLFLASRTCGSTMRYARSMLEWMEEGLVRDFETASANQPNQNQNRNRSGQSQNAQGTDNRNARAPFDFRYLKLLERKSQITRNLDNTQPAVILASDTSLDWGFSRQVLRHVANDPRNLVILSERSRQSDGKPSLGSTLWDLWQLKNDDSTSTTTATAGEGSGVEFTSDNVQLQPLSSGETLLYQQYLARQRQLHNVVQGDGGGASGLETSADVVDDQSDSSSSSSEDSDVELQGKALNISTTMSHARHNKLGLSDVELGINILIRRKGVHDYDVRGKRGREKMFPFMSKKRRGDDFGDVIRPEEYLRAEERDEVEGEDLRQNGPGKENAVGQKRRWGDASALGGAASGRRALNGVSKRRKSNDETASRGASVDVDGDTLVGDAMEEQSESDGEDESEKIDGPSKVIFQEETFMFECRVSFVDFSGLHDKRVLQQLVPLIQPRKLILVGGEEDETLALAEDFRKRLSTESGGSGEDADVFTPVVGRTVDGSVDTNAWVVKLGRSLVRNLQWQQVRGLGVVAITGRLEAATLGDDEVEGKTKKKLKTTSGESHDVDGSESQEATPDLPPVLDVVPANMAAGTRTVAQPLHVGDMRLADLRKIMQASGLSAEFRGEGTLLVNGIVAVRKTGTGRIEVEGAGQSMASLDTRSLKPTFFEVKQRIYEGLAVVAGS